MTSPFFKTGEAARPLYGIILNGPYPKPYHVKPPIYPQPYKPFRPVYRPPPIPYAKPQIPYYPSPPPYYPVPPPTPAVVPYRQPAPYTPPVTQPAPYTPPVTQPEPYRPPVTQPEPYRPPTTPAYQSTTPYRPPLRRPVSNPVRFPVPTTFDIKPWEPMIPTSASYVLDPAFQLNEVDGYPWTEELRDEDAQEEELKDKLPDLLFREKLPPKSLAQQHAAENEINFSPNPELRPWIFIGWSFDKLRKWVGQKKKT